ncbi:histone deacetylase [Thraustotheca clavata]|uniref:Histone deacetylase n=1 Tax=Thraustotheca clavata TaxID=74557 RepID=A0A1W0A937_9STRA|nr:histone deacetylase [Thraustotheca clavata]
MEPPVKKPRLTPFQPKHLLEYGLKIEDYNEKNEVSCVRCQFCTHFGREDVDAENRKRKKTSNHKTFSIPFRPENYRKHHETQHAEIWKQYQSASIDGKQQFFDKAKQQQQNHLHQSQLLMPSIIVPLTSAIVGRVGYVCEELFMWHAPWPHLYSLHLQPYTHWEHPETKRRFHGLLAVSGLLDKLSIIRARPATNEDLLLNHTQAYIDEIKEKSRLDNGGDAGDEAQFARGGFEIACLSAGGVLSLVDAVMNKHVEMGYALVRPPGHHALRDKGMGFCIFNNIAIAANYLMQIYQIGKIAIVDYDVHHGNGTQASFEADDRVLFISVHQAGNYPLTTGWIEETGIGPGAGYTINVPLPPGSGHGAYMSTFDRVVIPALEEFGPEFILVSSGFDAEYCDPLSQMMAHSETFRMMASKLKGAAATLCEGRIVFCHEGGYSESYVPFCGAAVIQELLGLEKDSVVVDPFLFEIKDRPYQDLQPHQQDVIDKVVASSKLLKERKDQVI